MKAFLKELTHNNDENRTEKPLLVEAFQTLLHGAEQLKIIKLWGSSIEGGTFSSFNFYNDGEFKFDFDVMVNILPVKLMKHDQVSDFLYVREHPGHLQIAVPNWKTRNISEKYIMKKENQYFISGFKVKKEFKLVDKYTFPNEPNKPELFIDSDPLDGKASVSINIKLHITPSRLLSEWKGISDKILNTAEKGEQEQGNLDEVWHDIASDILLKSVLVHIDLVPAIECESWPSVAEEWITREREWLPKPIIDKIVKDGFYVVPKSSPGGDPKLEWRLSFSKAELTLAENRTDVQKKCYYIFKSVVKENLDSDIVSTYHLKTLMMWAIEQNPPEYWKENNVGQAVLGLLDDLLQAVEKGFLAHYFIKEINLLRDKSSIALCQVASKILFLQKSFMNIDRNKKVFISTKAKNTFYEPVMSFPQKTFKKYHSRFIDALFSINASCMQQCHEFMDNSRNPYDNNIEFNCLSYPLFNLVEEFLIEQYSNRSSVIKEHLTQVKNKLQLEFKSVGKRISETDEWIINAVLHLLEIISSIKENIRLLKQSDQKTKNTAARLHQTDLELKYLEVNYQGAFRHESYTDKEIFQVKDEMNNNMLRLKLIYQQMGQLHRKILMNTEEVMKRFEELFNLIISYSAFHKLTNYLTATQSYQVIVEKTLKQVATFFSTGQICDYAFESVYPHWQLKLKEISKLLDKAKLQLELSSKFLKEMNQLQQEAYYIFELWNQNVTRYLMLLKAQWKQNVTRYLMLLKALHAHH